MSSIGNCAAEEVRSTTGKPYIECTDGKARGLAIAHIRQAMPPFSVMAVADEPLIGLDAELWPTATDAAFLTSVAAPEDTSLIKHIVALSRDPATFLWVAKEAALKASGEVMVDPRNISVELSPNGHFCAATSVRSSAPMAQTNIRIWRFNVKGSNADGLLALAVVARPRPKAGDDVQWRVIGADLELAPVF